MSTYQPAPSAAFPPSGPSGPSASPVDVQAQLRDLERQGGGMARLAHVCAGLLLFAFSLGSLISISASATARWLAEWNAGTFDLPDAINIVVNLLLVLCADVALLYAASVLRTLLAAQAPKEEMRVHTWAMFGAAALESASYLYLVWSFDRPTTAFLWAIAITRALAAPLYAAYLSMARALPVGPRDVAYQAALASGKGVVHDVATLAADPGAPLHRKVRIYNAASLMHPQDRARFNAIIEAVSDEPEPADARDARDASGTDDTDNAPAEWEPVLTPPGLSAPMLAPITPPILPPLPPKPPTGPGSPSAAPAAEPSAPDLPNEVAAAMRSARPTLVAVPRRRGVRTVGAKVRARLADEALEHERRRIVDELLRADPAISVHAVAKALKSGDRTAKRMIEEWQRAQRQAAQ